MICCNLHEALILFFLYLSAYSQPALPTISFENNFACQLTVDAGPDMNLCLPGEVELMGSVNGDALFTEWTPTTGLSDPFILTPTADITSTITYTLTGWGIDPANPNIIENGDFEDGNTGFSSDYMYVQDQPFNQEEMVTAGTYTVINNPFLVHEAWSTCMDHTPGSADQMMLINGELALQDFWCQTVDVLPGTYYNIEAWVTSVHPSSPAILQFSINGTPIGPIINAPSTLCEWIPFNAVWNAGSTTTAEICIINLNTTAFGNDFALDDITMVALCGVEDEVTITLEEEPAPVPEIIGPSTICADETATYTASLPGQPLILNYFWSVPSGATIVSGQGTPEITVEWNSAQTGSVCLMIETACDENENCYEVIINSLPEPPSISGPASLCPGETATLSTPVQDPENEYTWIVPPELELISGQGSNEIVVEWAGIGDADICLEVTNSCGTMDQCISMQLFPEYLSTFDTVLCEGATIIINGTEYGNGNLTGTENLVSINGCDSLVDVIITEVASLEFMDEVTLCPGDSIFLQGGYQFNPGIYIDTFTTAMGCDSIVITEVNVSATDTTYINGTTCIPSEAGTTIETFAAGNCDSTVITQTILLPSDTVLIIQSTCIAADTGQVNSTYSNQFGCDSIVTIHTLFQLSDTTRLFDTSCDINDVGVFTEELNNINGCDSLVITTITFSLSDTTELSNITCSINDTSTTSTLFTNINGCDSLVIQYILYGGSDTTLLETNSCFPADTGWTHLSLMNQNGCDSIISTYVEFILSDTTYIFLSSCNPVDTGINTEIFTDYIGCDSVVVTQTELGPGILIEAEVDSMYGGFGVPCFGDNAGFAHVDIISGGGSPFSVDWSNGDSTFVVSNLFPGKYFVIVTDQNDCSAIDSIEILEPPGLTLEIDTSGISCFNEDDGSVLISKVEGGVMPWTSSLNGSPFQNNNTYNNLSAGNYTLLVKDGNGCVVQEDFILIEPESWSVKLGPDTTVTYGTSLNIEPQISGSPTGELQYIWSDEKCENCTSRIFELNSNLSIQLLVTDENGCTASDIINFEVLIPEMIFIPNVFSPNDDQANDHFFIITNPFIELIDELSIFDRWGNMVFQKFNFPPNEPAMGWDGRFEGQPLNPAVFAYKVVVNFRNGDQKIFHGDVTLVR